MEIRRHATAISRRKLSAPVQAAWDAGLLKKGMSFFDYGCGKGDDLRILKSLGVKSSGWDPVFRPLESKSCAQVVNLGYVINVIEDPEERSSVLQESWSLTKDLLIVSSRPKSDLKSLKRYEEFGDGVLTSSKTFQKFYDRDELESWIQEVLGEQPVYAGSLIFHLFR